MTKAENFFKKQTINRDNIHACWPLLSPGKTKRIHVHVGDDYFVIYFTS